MGLSSKWLSIRAVRQELVLGNPKCRPISVYRRASSGLSAEVIWTCAASGRAPEVYDDR